MPPKYNAKMQCAEADNTVPSLSKEQTEFVQQVLGTLLYYGRAVNPTTLIALSTISVEQATPHHQPGKDSSIFILLHLQEEAVICTRQAICDS